MPSGIMRKYAPDDVSIVVGTQAVSGVHEGSFVEAERAVDATSLDVGSDGEVTLVINPNQSGTVKITLQQASPLNDYFAAMHAAIQNKDTTNGLKSLLIKDANGSTVVESPKAAVQKVAKVTFADKAEGREWTFLCGYLNIKPGGSVEA